MFVGYLVAQEMTVAGTTLVTYSGADIVTTAIAYPHISQRSGS